MRIRIRTTPTRRVAVMLVAGSVAGAVAAPATRLRAQSLRPPIRHGIAMHGEPALPPGFATLPYVNPDAPRGGRIILALQGTYDSLNPLVVRGVAPDALTRFVLQSLLFRSPDEPFSLYGMLASGVELPDDRSQITFHLDPAARFSDGRPVRAADVRFSFEMLKQHGKPFHRASLGRVAAVETPDDRTVRFVMSPEADRETPLIVATIPIFAAHATDPERFPETTFTPLLGSGPYLISDVRPGESLTLSRRADFWAEGRPWVRGLHNFQTIRYDFYRDANTLFEAFKAGLHDYRVESDPTRWSTGYDVPAVREGRIRLRSVNLAVPKGMSGFVFNTRRPLFGDVRVREALAMMFDFEWANRNLYFGLYRRSDSFFANSDLSSAGRPASANERAILEKAGARLPEAMLDGSWAPPVSDGSGRDRELARAAVNLLAEAGFALRDGVMRRSAGGEALAFEITVTSRPQERLALNYASSLERIGVQARIRLVDDVQYWRRLAAFDIDMVQWNWPVSASPGNEQANRWGSAAAARQGSLNYAGAGDPAIDAMIAAMLGATDHGDFVAAVRGLDRVLLAGHYVVPLFYLPDVWIGHQRGIAFSERLPRFGLPSERFGVPIETLWRAPDMPDGRT